MVQMHFIGEEPKWEQGLVNLVLQNLTRSRASQIKTAVATQTLLTLNVLKANLFSLSGIQSGVFDRFHQPTALLLTMT